MTRVTIKLMDVHMYDHDMLRMASRVVVLCGHGGVRTARMTRSVCGAG